MRFTIWTIATIVALAANTCFAQAKVPSVASIMKRYDGNQDGVLTKDEVAKSQYARQFPRWDADKDGKAWPTVRRLMDT